MCACVSCCMCMSVSVHVFVQVWKPFFYFENFVCKMILIPNTHLNDHQRSSEVTSFFFIIHFISEVYVFPVLTLLFFHGSHYPDLHIDSYKSYCKCALLPWMCVYAF